jgi:AraC-like DNA-binding protein
VGNVRPDTVSERRRVYLHARVVIARHYRRELQRAFAQFGQASFSEELSARRMTVAAQLLIEQRWIAVEDIARLVGYNSSSHFARVFRRRFGLSPARFREQALAAALQAEERS